MAIKNQIKNINYATHFADDDKIIFENFFGGKLGKTVVKEGKTRMFKRFYEYAREKMKINK
jgi:hypothetical protein